MKVLVNGNSIGEIIKQKYSRGDIDLASSVLNHIKTNKHMYARLVFLTAMMLHFNINFAFANTASIDASLDATFTQILQLLLNLSRWGCLAMGLKRTIEEILMGATFKQASTAGLGYWLTYLFVQFYPRLFDMIKF